MYWGDGGVLGVPAKIAVIEMDGSNPRTLLSNGIRSPSYMALDYTSQSLYFTDTFNRRVMRFIFFITFYFILTKVKQIVTSYLYKDIFE